MPTVKERWFKQSYELQMSLIDRVLCTKEELMDVQRMMQPCQLEDVSFERASIGLCGHVGCGLAARPFGGKKWLVDRKSEKVWDQQELSRFCSKACYASYMKLKATLQDEPAWNEATRPDIVPVRQPLVKPVAPQTPLSSPGAPHPHFATCDVGVNDTRHQDADVHDTRPHDASSSPPLNPCSISSAAVSGPRSQIPPIRQPAVIKVRFTQPPVVGTKTTKSSALHLLDQSSIPQKEDVPRTPPVPSQSPEPPSMSLKEDVPRRPHDAPQSLDRSSILEKDVLRGPPEALQSLDQCPTLQEDVPQSPPVAQQSLDRSSILEKDVLRGPSVAPEALGHLSISENDLLCGPPKTPPSLDRHSIPEKEDPFLSLSVAPQSLERPSISQEEDSSRSPAVAPWKFPGFVVNTEVCLVRASSSTAVPSIAVTPLQSATSRPAVVEESRRARKIPRLGDAVVEKVHDALSLVDSSGECTAGEDEGEDEDSDDDWDMFDMRDTFDDDDPDDKQADLSRRQEHLTNSSFFLQAWQFLSSAVQDKTLCLLRGEPYAKTEFSCDRRDVLLDRWYPWIREYNGDATDVAELVSTFQMWQAMPGASAEETLLLRFILLLCLEQLNTSEDVKKRIEEIAQQKHMTADNLAALRDIFLR